MKYNPDIYHRQSIRLKNYDYSQAGSYFVTICCHQKQCLFGEIADGVMQLNKYGEIVAQNYQWLSQRYPYLILDQWIVMPNHFHGIIILTDKNLPINPELKRKPLGRLIGVFKTMTTKQINLIQNTPAGKIWQRNYYEHIIRDERSLDNIRRYITNNSLSWQNDRLHPNNPSEWQIE